MPEPQELNEVLKDKKIISIEPGSTPDWMVINLEPKGIVKDYELGERAFLTVFVGGRKGSSDDNYYATCALHVEGEDRFGSACMVRDEGWGTGRQRIATCLSQVLGWLRLQR